MGQYAGETLAPLAFKTYQGPEAQGRNKILDDVEVHAPVPPLLSRLPILQELESLTLAESRQLNRREA
ncbi:hypothetical protein D9M70_605030 [compost metagenome]